jgi:hypothetical protein
MAPDSPSETSRVLKEKEEKQYGEYRTRRLVLEAWRRIMGLSFEISIYPRFEQIIRFT